MEHNAGSAWSLRLILEFPDVMGELKGAGIREQFIVDLAHKIIWAQIERNIDQSTGELSEFFVVGLSDKERNELNRIRAFKNPGRAALPRIIERIKLDYAYNCIERLSNLGLSETQKRFDDRRPIAELISELSVLINQALMVDKGNVVDLIKDVVPQMFADIKRRAIAKEKVSTGFQYLDYYTEGGFDFGDLVVFMGPTSVGKTAAAIIAQFMSLVQGLKVFMIGLEMEPMEYAKRMLANHAYLLEIENVSGTQIKRPDKSSFNFDGAERIVDDWKRQKFDNKYSVVESINVSDLKRQFYIAKHVHKADVIILDHTLLVEADGRDDEKRTVSKVINFMKQFAAKNKVICIALSQVTRDSSVTGRTDLKQSPTSAAGSRDLENAATVMIRIDPYIPEMKPPVEQKSGNKFETTLQQPINMEKYRDHKRFSILKNRNGIKGVSFKAIFKGNHSTFVEEKPSNWQLAEQNDFPIPLIYEDN